MKKIILILLLASFTIYAQQDSGKKTLYKGFWFDMPIKAAKQEFKKNKKEYITISFGNGVIWRIYPQNFITVNNKLTALLLVPKGMILALSHEEAKIYLRNSKQFFEDKGYKILIEPNNWDIPILFSQNSVYGLVMYNPEKTIVIELRSVVISPNVYTVNLGINNYDNFQKYIKAREQIIENKQKAAGF